MIFIRMVETFANFPPLGLVLVVMLGIGTLISMMLPYAIAFALVRIPMLLVWIWAKLPLGIEGPIYYTP